MTQSRLAQAVGLDRSTMVGVLHPLEARQLVERRRGDDRRTKACGSRAPGARWRRASSGASACTSAASRRGSRAAERAQLLGAAGETGRVKKRAPKRPFPLQSNCLHAVSRLAVRGDVQAFALLFFRHAQADRHVDDLVGDEGDDAGPDDRHADRLRLHPDLLADRGEAGAWP